MRELGKQDFENGVEAPLFLAVVAEWKPTRMFSAKQQVSARRNSAPGPITQCNPTGRTCQGRTHGDPGRCSGTPAPGTNGQPTTTQKSKCSCSYNNPSVWSCTLSAASFLEMCSQHSASRHISIIIMNSWSGCLTVQRRSAEREDVFFCFQLSLPASDIEPADCIVRSCTLARAALLLPKAASCNLLLITNLPT